MSNAVSSIGTPGPSICGRAGEAEFASVNARLAETGHFGAARICEGFVGYADLTMGNAVDEMLEALIHASDGRLRGIRCPTVWDRDPLINPSSRPFAPEGLMDDPTFRAGVARVTAHDLVYDAWQYYPQLSDLARLAAAMPNTTFVCGHVGGLVGNRAYSGARQFRQLEGQGHRTRQAAERGDEARRPRQRAHWLRLLESQDAAERSRT